MNKDFTLKCIILAVCSVLVLFSITIMFENRGTFRRFSRNIDSLEDKEYALMYSELIELGNNINELETDILYYYGELILKYEDYTRLNSVVKEGIKSYEGLPLQADLEDALYKIEVGLDYYDGDLGELSAFGKYPDLHAYLDELGSINRDVFELITDDQVRVEEMERQAVELKLKYNLLKRDNKKLLEDFQ